MKSLDSDNATLFIIKNIKECRNDVICSVQVFFYLLTKKNPGKTALYIFFRIRNNF